MGHLGAERTLCYLLPAEVRNPSARDPQPHGTGPNTEHCWCPPGKRGQELGSRSCARGPCSERVPWRLDGCHANALALGQTGAVCCAKPVTEAG